jgi:hypothetical protein
MIVIVVACLLGDFDVLFGSPQQLRGTAHVIVNLLDESIVVFGFGCHRNSLSSPSKFAP